MTKQEFLNYSLGTGLKINIKYNNGCADTLHTELRPSDLERSISIIPILRPLSDLTKPIKHNGEVFVPMLKLVDPKNTEWDKMEAIQYNPFPTIWNHSLWYKVMHQELGEILQINPKNMNVIPFYLFQQLIKWHFAIGINECDYIDINTLTDFKY